MRRTIKAWGNDSPDDMKKPHTCTLDRKFWFSDNGSCIVTDIDGREK